jgi:GMP synthase (glutamine-hydrolysing)
MSSSHTQVSRILILDFGSQYTQLIARRIRELHVYCEIHPSDVSPAFIEGFEASGIVLSGGPSSVLDADSPDLDPSVFELGIPILGICYGLQLLVQRLGGSVEAAEDREYGRAHLKIEREDPLFEGLATESEQVVWMSHGDRVLNLPAGFEVVASSGHSPFAAVRSCEAPIWGLQFHPEVAHTENGARILGNFVLGICACEPSWTMDAFIDESIARIRAQVGEGSVICGLSGGVDSSVAAALVHRAVGDQLTCIFVDHGLMRENERAEVEDLFQESLGVKLVSVDVEDRFLKALSGVCDPEHKRRIIGGLFIEIFEEEAVRIGGAGFLVQGTL